MVTHFPFFPRNFDPKEPCAAGTACQCGIIEGSCSIHRVEVTCKNCRKTKVFRWSDAC